MALLGLADDEEGPGAIFHAPQADEGEEAVAHQVVEFTFVSDKKYKSKICAI